METLKVSPLLAADDHLLEVPQDQMILVVEIGNKTIEEGSINV